MGFLGKTRGKRDFAARVQLYVEKAAVKISAIKSEQEFAYLMRDMAGKIFKIPGGVEKSERVLPTSAAFRSHNGLDTRLLPFWH